jgi:hypothetical protein
MKWITGKTDTQNSVRKKSFGGTFTFSNCHIIGLDTGSNIHFVVVVLVVVGSLLIGI